MPTPDYSARDKAVKINVYASVRRREGLSHENFAHYWRDVHATLCARLPGLGFYVQQHFDREGGSNLWPAAPGVARIDAVLDGSAELGFASERDQAIFIEAGKILYEDERNLFGEAVAYNLPNGSITLVDREKDGLRNGADRLHRVHVYMSCRPGKDAASWLRDSSADLASLEIIQKWKLHLPEPYDNAHPAPPSPDVGHTVGSDRLHLAVAEVAFENARAARSFFSSPAFRRVLAAQAQHVNAIAAYRVSGFYTFVRDGVPTTAGIRGSRSSELIDELGASNQVTADVRERFVRTGGSGWGSPRMNDAPSTGNKSLVLTAFDTLFNKRDYEAAAAFWSSDYIQHSAHIAPGRDGLFNLVRSLPATLKYENSVVMAEGDLVMMHGRFSGSGLPANWVAADIVRLDQGLLVEHWDVIQDEATLATSKSGRPMFGHRFPS